MKVSPGVPIFKIQQTTLDNKELTCKTSITECCFDSLEEAEFATQVLEILAKIETKRGIYIWFRVLEFFEE